jgi:hypothetical protein
MMKMPFSNPLSFDYPASYQIRVQGWIDPGWSDRLEGMTISLILVKDGPSITFLEGELSDQTALAGVLNSLYELHLPVILVKCMNVNQADQQDEA